jgi:hypothetical protein
MLRRVASGAGRVRIGALGVTLALGTALGGLAGAPTPAGALLAGPAWSTVESPVQTGAGTVLTQTERGIDCPSPGWCVAVSSANATGPGFISTADVLSAGHWSAEAIPAPAGGQVPIPEGVACSAARACVAVGSYLSAHTGDQAAVFVETGTLWTALALTLPTGALSGPGQLASLQVVSCPAAGGCVAVGSFKTTGGGTAALLAVQHGSTWTATAAAAAPGASTGAAQDAELQGISCPAPGVCVAAGRAATASGEEPLLVSLAGGSWTSAAGPVPSDTLHPEHAYLQAVSCAVAGWCVATGYYTETTGGTEALIETLSAGTWTAASVAMPAGSAGRATDTVALTAVSCPVVGWCAAAGDYVTSTPTRYAGLLLTLSGGSWSATSAGIPVSATSNLGSLSCAQPGLCEAVGRAKVTGVLTGEVESLSGGTWTASSTPVPTNAASGLSAKSELTGVSCAGPTCAASGDYNDMSAHQPGFLESFGTVPGGYLEAASDGGIFAFTVPFHGSMGATPLNKPVVGVAADPYTGGYYEVASDGGIFAFTAPFHGSMGSTPLNKPVVGMAFDTRTGGYYEVASDGGIFAFTAPFHGSMGATPLNKPVVGMAFDPATGGYWLVASDGGIFAFTAPFHGSMGTTPLNKPVVGIAADSLTGGYYEVASDGGLFAFTAPFHGSLGATAHAAVAAMAFDYGTGGYYEVGVDSSIAAYTAPSHGPTPPISVSHPVVGVAIGAVPLLKA